MYRPMTVQSPIEREALVTTVKRFAISDSSVAYALTGSIGGIGNSRSLAENCGDLYYHNLELYHKTPHAIISALNRRMAFFIARNSSSTF